MVDFGKMWLKRLKYSHRGNFKASRRFHTRFSNLWKNLKGLIFGTNFKVNFL